MSSAGAIGLVIAIVNFIKNVRAGNVNGWLTMLAVWLAGVGVVLLLRASDFGATITLGDFILSEVNFATAILAGLGLGSAALLANDFKQALDGQDSARKPDLVPPSDTP